MFSAIAAGTGHLYHQSEQYAHLPLNLIKTYEKSLTKPPPIIKSIIKKYYNIRENNINKKSMN